MDSNKTQVAQATAERDVDREKLRKYLEQGISAHQHEHEHQYRYALRDTIDAIQRGDFDLQKSPPPGDVSAVVAAIPKPRMRDYATQEEWAIAHDEREKATQQLPDAQDCDDTARIDALESHTFDLTYLHSIGIWFYRRDSKDSAGFDTAREAIDAARSAERKP